MMSVPRRPTISSVALCVATAVYLLVLQNLSFWARVHTYFPRITLPAIGFALAYCAITVALCTLVSSRYLIKPALIFFIMVSACSAYFADNFGVLMNGAVVSDLMTTTSQEAGSFLSWHLVGSILLFGVVPSLLIAYVRVVHHPIRRKLAVGSTLVFACLALATTSVLANYAGLLSAVGGRRDLLQSSNPFGSITAAFSFATTKLKERSLKLHPIGTDARRNDAGGPSRLPLVTVVVVGESARAQNFGLDGYGRDTTPELRAAAAVNYTSATSCGTETAISLPCMFSMYGRANFSPSKALSTENLLDVLKRAGIPSVWWENQAGSKGVADRVDYRRAPVDPVNCPTGDCFDQVLLKGLDVSLNEVKGDTVILLHQRGSHGPSYYLEYPAEFRRFEPECRTAHLVDCSADEIANAYDNSILYTDHLLGEIIRDLSNRQDRIAPAMIYLSDHGESLGEGGLYMHGTPYFMAPSQQTHIPFVVWLGEAFSEATGIDPSCLKESAGKPVSQDNLFPSVLGMMNVSTDVHNPALDLFASCRSAETQ